MKVKKHQLNWTWNNELVPKWERSMSKLYIVTLLISLICRVHYVNDVAQAGIQIGRRNINNLRYADDMAENKEERKGLLMKVKEESG